uniref:Uncharacterized protein n=1 Tax=Arundo donax TaxID=35708 RepID=A0A0A9B658_ARUDO
MLLLGLSNAIQIWPIYLLVCTICVWAQELCNFVTKNSFIYVLDFTALELILGLLSLMAYERLPMDASKTDKHHSLLDLT